MTAITTEINILDMPEFKEMVEIIRVIIKDDIVPKVHKDAFDGWFERLRLKRGKGGVVFDGEPAARKICKLIEVAETKAAQHIDGLTASVKEHASQGHIDANTGQWKYLDPAYVQELSRAKEEWKIAGTLIADLGAAADKIREEAEHNGV